MVVLRGETSGVAWASPKVGPHYINFFRLFCGYLGPNAHISYKFMTLYAELMKVSNCPSITAFWIKYNSYSI